MTTDIVRIGQEAFEAFIVPRTDDEAFIMPRFVIPDGVPRFVIPDGVNAQELYRALRDEELHAGGLAIRLALNMNAQSVSAVAISSLNFSKLFPGAFQVIQTDLGLTYGGTLLASGTSPPAVGLTGSTSVTAKPIRVTTSAGALGTATYTISHDGGATTAQSGTTAATVAITALPGMSITFPSATYNANNVFLATCAALADQSGNGKNYTQATASKQPVLTVGLNGKPGLQFDGVDDNLASALTLAAPGTTPFLIYYISRIVFQTVGTDEWIGNAAGGSATYYQFTNQVAFYLGNTLSSDPNTNAAIWNRTAISLSGISTDVLKVGQVASALGNAGNVAFSDMQVGGSGGRPGKIEMLALLFVPLTSYASADVGINSLSGYGLNTVQGCFFGFASLFPNARQVVQTDLGLTYGGTMLASGTSPPAVGLTGSTSVTAKPIRVTTSAGALGAATYTISHDEGATIAQSGTTAASVAISALPGLSLTFPSAAYSANNVFLATCSAIADQSGNGWHYTQASAGAQPVVGIGLNGKPSLDFDGSTRWISSNLTLPAPTTGVPNFLYALWQAAPTGGAAQMFTGGSGFAMIVYSPDGTLNGISQYDGAQVNPAPMPANTWLRGEARFGNAVSDFVKLGSGTVATGSNSGSSAGTNATIGAAVPSATQCSNMKLLAACWLPYAPSPSQLANSDIAVNTPDGYGYNTVQGCYGFAPLFPGAYQVVQSDLGFTYGGTLRASGTSPPVVGLSGNTSLSPKPIRITTSAGALGTATYTLSLDGGTTVAQSGTTAATVAIAGLAGLSVTFPAGPYSADNVFLATCSALADQSGNGYNYTQSTPAYQPVVTVGINGKVGLLFDGVDDCFSATVSTLVTPCQIILVCRMPTSTQSGFQSYIGSPSANGDIDNGAAGPYIRSFANGGITVAFSSTNAVRIATTLVNTGVTNSDTLRIGSSTTLGNNGTSYTLGTGRFIGGRAGRWGNIEVFSVIIAPIQSLATFDVALNSSPAYGTGNIAV